MKPRTYYLRWSPDLIEKLKKMWADNVPPRIVANELGFTTGAINQQAYRLGLKRARTRVDRERAYTEQFYHELFDSKLQDEY